MARKQARRQPASFQATAGEQIPAPLSKSAKKRESAALQKLGEELASLPAADREELGLSPELLEALALHDRITDREAARRQKQYIGKLMRGLDATAIGKALATRRNLKAGQIARFQRAEKWREGLINAPESSLGPLLSEIVQASVAARKNLDPGALKILTLEARNEKDLGTPKGTPASARLFALLAEIPVQ